MRMHRRQFLQTAAASLAAGSIPRTAQADDAPPAGKRIIYYNNFASHLLCAYNPNMYYPQLPFRWSDDDWRSLIDMLAGFGFNVFEFWLEPRMFCREALASDVGREYARQMNEVAAHAHKRNMKAEMLVCVATTGENWTTRCPNVKEEWDDILFLWDAWTKRLPTMDIVGIFPGDPGACSRNGCTAETYIDKSIEVSALVKRNIPNAEIEFSTWGPPFFGWGNIHMPEGSHGEFIQADQSSAWTFSKERADRSMTHLLQRLGDFPKETWVSINLGFNGDGNPEGEQDARPWAREIAKKNPILTWDFSLTEGENAVFPHYRFSRLFARRREENGAAPYRGGICFTMTPLLNQLSLYESARSFNEPDGDPYKIAGDYFALLFGEKGRGLAGRYRLFEAMPDWGSYDYVKMPREQYHREMKLLVEQLEDLKSSVNNAAVFHPSPEAYRTELAYFAKLFADLSSPAPDYDALKKSYWERVYRIYDQLPTHVDPRPHQATERIIQHFKNWK